MQRCFCSFDVAQAQHPGARQLPRHQRFGGHTEDPNLPGYYATNPAGRATYFGYPKYSSEVATVDGSVAAADNLDGDRLPPRSVLQVRSHRNRIWRR